MMKKTVSLLVCLIVALHVYGQTVDVHCHNVLPEFKTFLDAHNASMEETFPLPDWDETKHLKFMEMADIGTSILSMPAPQPYYGDTEECQRVVREYNERCAELKSRYPDKFRFCASLPLPDVMAAIREAVYALDSLGADGIKLATNSRGQYLGDEALDTLMSVLNERNAVIVLHPHRPTPYAENVVKNIPLAMYEYPAETTRAVVNMIVRNVPVRYPNLKIIVPHCGSFLPLAMPRMKSIHTAMVAKNVMQPIDWERNLEKFYYDLAGYSNFEVIKTLLTITVPEHMLYGSDYPYLSTNVLISAKERLLSDLRNDTILCQYVDMIMGENARKLFNINTTK